MNEELAQRVLQAALDCGVREFCICPGGRSAPFYSVLLKNPEIKTYHWHEERSAAFFALGRSRACKRPVATIVTSGTAAGELLPAAMEAHYSEIPLLLITADRPRRFRFSGAPQTAEQVNLFGRFAHFEQDLEGNETCTLAKWEQRGPCHVNVCFEEPRSNSQKLPLFVSEEAKIARPEPSKVLLERFLGAAKRPLVFVSALEEEAKGLIVDFLAKLNAPVYLESLSNIRENPRLQRLRIFNPDVLSGYCDSVLRIGGVPTHRAWRDLEECKLPTHSVSEVPYSGLSYADVTTACIADFFQLYDPPKSFAFFEGSEWQAHDCKFREELEELFLKEPKAEPSLFRELSLLIPDAAQVYLGNSMPIRNWELGADNGDKGFTVRATKGLNGIDGQLSCFFGLCEPRRSNWALLGDFTTLYDLSAPWILEQLEAQEIKIVVINNFGGRIFARKFDEIEIQNPHQIQFEHFAKLWGLPYEKWHSVPEHFNLTGRAVIELSCEVAATERFWKSFRQIKKGSCLYFR